MTAALPRRTVLTSVAAMGASAVVTLPPTPAFAAASRGIKLGLDNFAVRAMKWKAPELLDYAARLRVDSLFITDLDAFESLETRALTELRKRAADLGVQIQLGSWSICPSSTIFKKTWGTAEEHLALCLRVAKDLGSPVARVVLGRFEDRGTKGGIAARIKDTVAVLKALRGRAEHTGVRIAIENHAGDLQGRELVGLIEDAGGKKGARSYVGANIDPGNATWAMEDPVSQLEILAPYVITSSMRDSMVWESENGATVQWTAMGDGVVDFPAYFERFVALCPEAPVHIETISGFNREIPYLKPEYWQNYPGMKAADLARFVMLAKKGSEKLGGKGKPPWVPPVGKDRTLAEQEYQKAELERSLKYCRETLSLGQKPAGG